MGDTAAALVAGARLVPYVVRHRDHRVRIEQGRITTVSTTPNDPNSGGYGGAPSYGSAPAAGSGSNPLAIVALVTGIISILTACFWFVAGPLGIAAIVTGVLGGNKAKRGEAGQKGLAKAGLITGVVGLVLTIVLTVLTLVGISMFGDQIEQCSTISDPTEQQQCLEDQLNS